MEQFKLSELLPALGYSIITMQNEQFFQTLALVESNPPSINVCTFIDKSQFIDQLSSKCSLISMLLVNPEVFAVLSEKQSCFSYGICVVSEPRKIFFAIHNQLSQCDSYKRGSFSSVIDSSAQISPLAEISQYNVEIGANVVIEAFVKVCANTVIMPGCIIRAGSIIGGVGFEFKRNPETTISVEHLGGVILEKNVEIQYNSTVDRAVYSWDNTVIGEYSKIDNLVYIAHGVKLGKRNLLVAHSSVGGRVVSGEDCWIGMGATVRNGLSLGERARVNMGAVVTKNVKADEAVSGNFAIEHAAFLSHLKNMLLIEQ